MKIFLNPLVILEKYMSKFFFTVNRLELKGDKIVLGEFLNFKGKQEDMQALVNVRRSKVGQLTIQKSSLFSGLGK